MSSCAGLMAYGFPAPSQEVSLPEEPLKQASSQTLWLLPSGSAEQRSDDRDSYPVLILNTNLRLLYCIATVECSNLRMRSSAALHQKLLNFLIPKRTAPLTSALAQFPGGRKFMELQPLGKYDGTSAWTSKLKVLLSLFQLLSVSSVLFPLFMGVKMETNNFHTTWTRVAKYYNYFSSVYSSW